MSGKNFILLFFIYFCCTTVLIEARNSSSKTFFSVQPIFNVTSPETVSIKRDQLRIENAEKKYSIDITAFGGESTNEKDLAKYFLPFNKSEILVGELGSKSVINEDADVIANYFNIFTDTFFEAGEPLEDFVKNYTFESKLSFRPKQKFYGAALTYKQHLSRYTDKGFWIEVILPVEHVKNDINIHEEVLTEGGPNGDNPNIPEGFVGNMIDVFKQTTWKFGRIDGSRSKTRIPDLYIKLGYNYFTERNYHLSSIMGFSLPTGNKPTGEFLFEPIVGQEGHATFFFGTSLGFKILSSCEKSVFFEFDLNGTIFFDNDQIRSFDLKGRPWSRYMWVYLEKKSGVKPSPGINTFTRSVNVSVGSSRDLNSAFVYQDKCINAEVGYHFYSREGEKIKLNSPWPKNIAIASVYDKDKDVIFGTISKNRATIRDFLNVENDTENGIPDAYKQIEESDLDLESAAHPCVISHKVYFSLAYNWCKCNHPKFFGIGASYEFGESNAILERWMAWARLGISF